MSTATKAVVGTIAASVVGVLFLVVALLGV
mgnify:CR=1 FL=1